MRILLSIFSMLMLSGWNWGGADTPPVSVPFDISTKGATATLEFRIKEEKQYPFLITIYGDLNSYELANYSEEDKNRAAAKALKLRLVKIKKDNTETTIIDDNFLNYSSYGYITSEEYSYMVSFPRLTKGQYRAYVTSLNDIKMYKEQQMHSAFSINHLHSK